MQLKTNSFLSYLQRGTRSGLWAIGFRPHYYASIDDLPIYYWWEIHESGDVSMLIKDSKFPITNNLLDYCSELWDDLQQQHLDYVGVSIEYSKYLRLVADVSIAKLQYAISNDNWDLFKLELIQDDLDELKGSPKEDNMETKSMIEKHWLNGQRLDPKKTTVKEYYSYIKSLQKQTANGK
jgi:hypothetical protein